MDIFKYVNPGGNRAYTSSSLKRYSHKTKRQTKLKSSEIEQP